MLFWDDPNKHLTVLEATKEAADEFGYRSGARFIKLRREHLDALEAGRMLAWHDSEYSTFVILEK